MNKKVPVPNKDTLNSCILMLKGNFTHGAIRTQSNKNGMILVAYQRENQILFRLATIPFQDSRLRSCQFYQLRNAGFMNPNFNMQMQFKATISVNSEAYFFI